MCIRSLVRWIRRRLHWVPLAVAPVLSKFLADKIDVPFVWPPLDAGEVYLAALSSGVVAFFGWLPARLRTKETANRHMWMAGGLSLLLLIVYGILVMKVVVAIETPHNGTQYRTIGFQRTVLAMTQFPNAPSEELIKSSGLNEGDIEKMWTPESILLAKGLLFVSYLGAIASLNFAVGAFNRSMPSTSD